MYELGGRHNTVHNTTSGELLGSPVVRTSCFHCHGPGFNLWMGDKDPANWGTWPIKPNQNRQGLASLVAQW